MFQFTLCSKEFNLGDVNIPVKFVSFSLIIPFKALIRLRMHNGGLSHGWSPYSNLRLNPIIPHFDYRIITVGSLVINVLLSMS